MIRTTPKVRMFQRIVIPLILVFFAGCRDKKEDAPVEISLQLLDKNGQVKTIFQQGDDVIFSFSMKTNESDLTWENDSFESNFLEVFTTSESLTALVSEGRPYQNIIIPAILGVNVKGANPFLKISWQGKINQFSYLGATVSNNTPLTKGSYFTTFSHTFKFQGYKDRLFSTRIDFTIN